MRYDSGDNKEPGLRPAQGGVMAGTDAGMDLGRYPLRRIALAISTLFLTGPAAAAPGDPLGPPFAVLGVTAPHQIQPAIARNAGGEFVVVWTDEASGAIFGRRFAADASPLDGGFQVSAPAASAFDVGAHVAIDADGDFIVAWQEAGRPRYEGAPPTGQGRAWARRYAADGTPAGAAFSLEAATSTFNQGAPAVAMDAEGDFIVAWERASVGFSTAAPGIGYGLEQIHLGQRQVVAQRYDRNGTAQGARLTAGQRPDLELQLIPITIPINGPAAGVQLGTTLLDSVAVAMDGDGDSVVAWGGNSIASAYVQEFIPVVLPLQSAAVFARRYDPQGRAVDNWPRTVDSSLQAQVFMTAPAVAMDAAGDYLVAWEQQSGILDVKEAVYARRFIAASASLGSPIQVGTPQNPLQPVAVAADAAGDFVVAWRPTDQQLEANRYSAAGTLLGSAAVASTTTQVFTPGVAADAAGNFVVTWQQLQPYVSGDTLPRYAAMARSYTGP
jgi:hypothetical protein